MVDILAGEHPVDDILADERNPVAFVLVGDRGAVLRVADCRGDYLAVAWKVGDYQVVVRYLVVDL